MMLSYYRNHLVHLFITDAEIASTLFVSKKEDRNVSSLYRPTQDLKEILNEEFVLKDHMHSQQDFANRLNFLHERGFLTKSGLQVSIDNED